MIYSKLSFKAFGRDIELHFKNRITLLGGDSGVGKTLIYQVLRDISNLKEYKNIKCINGLLIIESERAVLSYLKGCKNYLIVIDNAEDILGNRERNYIAQDIENQYLILGRNRTGLYIAETSDGVLEVTKNSMSIKYPFYEDTLYALQNVSSFIPLP